MKDMHSIIAIIMDPISIYRYVIVISRLGGMYPVYSHEHEGAKRPSASDCKPDTSRLGVI